MDFYKSPHRGETFHTPYKRKAQCGDYQQQDTYVPKGRDNENK